MKTLSDFYQLFPNRPAAAPAPRPLPAPVAGAREETRVGVVPVARPDRYRERATGTGYGRSSGYAAARSYTAGLDQRLLRVG